VNNLMLKIIEDECLETDKHNTHSYVQNFYEERFLPYKDNEITLLEIGTNRGWSIRLWYYYFKNASMIYAMDTFSYADFVNFLERGEADPTHRAMGYSDISPPQNIKYVIGDAYTRESCNLIPDCDIIIDDGPHSLDSQLKGLELYLSKVKPGGLFVIEDIQSIENQKQIHDKALSLFPNFKYELLDFRESRDRYDDLMFIATIPK
jgi:SAM-dependent methyltransferase